MKVLVLTSLFPNRVRPTHAVFVRERMFAYVKNTGSEIRVVAPIPYFPRLPGFGRWSAYAEVPVREEMCGIPVYHPRHLITPWFGMTLYAPWYYLGVRGLVQRVRREFPFDLIDAHYAYPDGAAAVMLGRSLGVPVVVSARGTDVNLYADMPIVRSWLRFAFGGADAVVAVSSALKDRILSLGIPGAKVFVVPNGVDREKFHPSSREEARDRTGLPRNRQVVLSVGNLVPAKGFRRLLSAFAAVARDRKDLFLAIVGEGPDRSTLEVACGELGLLGQVLFAGRVPHEGMVHWYNAADLFCLASEREGCPNAVQEALACGIPVVATPVGGIREILGEHKVGLLARDLGVEELSRCLAKALAANWDRGEIARTGSARSWREVSSDLQEIFRFATRRVV